MLKLVGANGGESYLFWDLWCRKQSSARATISERVFGWYSFSGVDHFRALRA